MSFRKYGVKKPARTQDSIRQNTFSNRSIEDQERVDRLKAICRVQSDTYKTERMVAHIIHICNQHSDWDWTHDNGNVYITKTGSNEVGETYPCIIAHTDTVHSIVSDLTVFETKYGELFGFNSLEMEIAGIGGDDKCGIFLALECLYAFPHVKVAFFRDEETGCEGSSMADVSFFEDCSFILQGDRNGFNDFIVDAAGVELSSVEWQDDITGILMSHGYDVTSGSITDVMQLKQLGIKPVMANVSCGYYNPHMNDEYINIYDLLNCMDLFFNLISEFGYTQYLHEYDDKYSDYSPTNWEDKYSWIPSKQQWIKNSDLVKGEFKEALDNIIGDTGSGFSNKTNRTDTICRDCHYYPANEESELCDHCETYYTAQYGTKFQGSDDYDDDTSTQDRLDKIIKSAMSESIVEARTFTD